MRPACSTVGAYVLQYVKKGEPYVQVLGYPDGAIVYV